MAHEVPQQMGCFLIARNAGATKSRALLFCSGIAVAAVVGAAMGLAAVNAFEWLFPYALAMSAASFLYITFFVLIPEVFAGIEDFRGNAARLGWIVLGAAASLLLMNFAHEAHGHGAGVAHVHVHNHASHEAHEVHEIHGAHAELEAHEVHGAHEEHEEHVEHEGAH